MLQRAEDTEERSVSAVTRIARLASEVGAAKLVRYSPRYGDALKGISMQKVAAARIFGPVVLARINFCPIHIVLASCTSGTRFLRECREAFTCPLLPAYIYIYIFTLLTTPTISERYCYVVVVLVWRIVQPILIFLSRLTKHRSRGTRFSATLLYIRRR